MRDRPSLRLPRRELDALLLRHDQALALLKSGVVDPLEALACVVAPSPELRAASLAAVEKAA